MIDGVDTRPVRRWRWPLWVALGVVGVLLFCGVPVGLTAVLIARMPDPASLPDTAASATPAVSPEPGDPVEVTAAWLGERIDALLDQQAQALLRGDEQGFLAVADPASPAAADLKRQFRVLRSMKVAAWHPSLNGRPTRMNSNTSEWRVLVTIGHCFVLTDCRTGPVTIGTRWDDVRPQPRLIAIEPSMSGTDGPRPWEVSDLAVGIGARTLVAVPQTVRDKLPDLLKAAEQAAVVADRYAVGGTRPDVYRIFYAPGAEWKLWYGGGRPAWTGGYAVGIGGDRFDVVLNGDGLHRTAVDDLLRHEMTHAASLPGRGYASSENWWLVEGIAEYAGAGGRPVAQYEGLADVTRLLAAGGGWNGKLESVEPADSAEDWRVSGSYGVGYLAVRYLVDRFGEEDLLAFYRLVVHEGRSVGDAAQQAFGVDWSALHNECVGYARSVAR
ncbi:hypothetical protein [Micromonospora sp. NBC_01796]|uniref:hypothetical protein n=1 Tax=Micromonospora sp. NBC_01796 TaxID=2975987 RepID=UPI002DD9DBD6|nr:hypothetical protein [Micromonospora sp. NBC_01796]WSA89074.1 hypothetical protein OIE47_16485 [Micromonospora sp. NBC_01796]